MEIKKMIEQLLGIQSNDIERVNNRVQYAHFSKHMLPSGMKATKRYADGRQKAPRNRRYMRKRK